MKVSILGMGWYGAPLALELKRQGQKVCGTIRNEGKKAALESQGVVVELLSSPAHPSAEMLESDIIVLNLPPSEMDWPKKWSFQGNPWMIFISSTSARPILIEAEEWIKNSFSSWTILRFGGLAGSDRNPGNTLSGKTNLKGRLWPVNLLHKDDAVGFTLALMEQNIRNEIINVVSDEHHTREEFYTDFAWRNNLVLPHFDPDDLSVKSPIPNHRAREIYQFKWPTMIGTSL